MSTTTNSCAVLEFVPKRQQDDYDTLKKDRDRYKADYQRQLKKNAYWHHLYVEALCKSVEADIQKSRERRRVVKRVLAFVAYIAVLLIYGALK